MESSNHHQRPVSPIDPTSASDAIQNMHDIFSDPYRCAVLYCLQRSEEPVTMSEVASTIVEWSAEMDEDELADVDRPRAWLLDNHVRHMDAFGTVVYDPGRDVVRLPEDVSISVSAPWPE